MDEIFSTDSSEETQKIGEAFAQKLQNGGVILLYGNLGAGKTTFVQGLAKGLGVEKRIISPTFVILRTYTIKDQKISLPALTVRQTGGGQVPAGRNGRQFYHIDLYRLEGQKHELEEIGLLDLLKDPQNIFAIEWPEKMKEFLPKNRWEMYFEHVDENKRKITIKQT